MTDRHKFMGDAPTREDGVSRPPVNTAASPASFPEGAPAGDDGGGKCSTVFTPSGKAKRKAIPASVKVELAIMQSGQGIACPLCSNRIWSGDPRVLEHMTPHATMISLGRDPNEFDNLRWVHKGCADLKTNGTKATTAGSDKHMIAKGERFDKINRGERSRKRKGPPLKSRGFDRTFRKRMNGKVERV